MTRIPELSREELNSEQGRVYDEIKAEGGPLAGPYTPYIRYPRLMREARNTSLCLAAGGLTKRERQIVVLAVVRFWGAEFPWAVQAKGALEAGLEPETIDLINAGGTPTFSDPREQVAYDVANELLHSRKLSEDSFNRAASLFDEQALVCLIGNIGQFSMTCLVTNAYECDPPADMPYRLKR